MRFTKQQLRKEYYNWLISFINLKDYTKLLLFLHKQYFIPKLADDKNRVGDGLSLRWRFALEKGIDKHFDYIEKIFDPNCSILEMIIALALRCEETIMDNPEFGNRTKQWFWNMIKNLGLSGLNDSHFDESIAKKQIDKFLYRKYKQDGSDGGLFYIPNCRFDLREVDIWTQLCWYLDNIS